MDGVLVRIPIEPIPKGRPRFKVFKGHVWAFTPKKTSAFEALVAKTYKSAAKNRRYEKGEPLEVTMCFGMPIPKSVSKKKKADMSNGAIRHTKKPDIDNLMKSILDALNGVAWEDDSQVIQVTASKVYSEEPYIWILVHESVA